MNVPRSFLFLLYFLNIKRDTLISIRNFIRYIQHQLLLLLPAVMGSKESSPPTQSMEPPPPPPPPPFDPLKPSIPISFPLNTLEDLESRSYFKSFHYPFNKTSESAPPITSPLPSRSRMLVCHDMSGGYTGDKWVQGGANEGAYAIWHWYLIDVFVYFSHNLVTIPPPCWTNAAHTHGVKVLGTFITEWDEGRAICNTLLLTKESAELYAERLTELAVALGFDGWLINMEVELDVSQLPNLKVFVDHLTKTMHSSMPGSLVIWYDSVTIDGKLSWQNQLNDNNKPFFDLCDGIFVNYTWEKDYPKLSATVAGDRKYDVYMGIDVFGRNTYGGGQWTTNVALDVIKKDDVSAAVFAPGWVYETKQPPDFQTAQNRWWGLVEKSWGIRQYYPKLLPFYSNFDQGHGYHFSVDGGQISNDPWCNISCQSFQPVLSSDVGSLADTIQFMVNFKDASFSGGGNITFEGTLEGNAYFTTMLFRGELPLDHMPIQITHSVKSDGSSLLGLSLQFSSKLNEKTTILIADETTNQLETKFDKFITPHRYTNSPNNPQSWIIHNANISMNGYTLTEIHVVCYKSKAHLNKSKVDQPPKQEGSELSQAGTWTSSAFLRLLCCCCSSDSRIGTALTLSTASDYAASLGHISIKYLNRTSEFPPSSSWVVEGEDISWAEGPGGSKRVSLKLSWSLIEGDSSQYRSYNIYVKNGGEGEEYIGVARVRSFYVYGFRVEPSVLKVRFVVQVCGMDGVCQKVDSSPSFVLDIEV